MLRNVKAPATSAATKPGSGRASKTKDKKKEKKDGTEKKNKKADTDGQDEVPGDSKSSKKAKKNK